MAQASLLSSGVAALTATVATATTSCRSPVVAPSGVHLGLAPLEVSRREEEEDWTRETRVFIQFLKFLRIWQLGSSPVF